MEVIEDDLFFADLSKQISLLIMDDDEPAARCPSVSFQGFSRGNYHHTTILPSQFLYEQSNEGGCRRESKGTGVFIPQSSQPNRRKQRQGRLSPFNTKSHHKQQQQQQHDYYKAKTVVSSQNIHSFNPKKG